jgi:DMSO/TMAO reductase YedYZ molybdopterin-dependent catalytic subunit
MTANKPSILTGALVGGLLTAPLIALIFLGYLLAGLPLIPFDVFDWMARILPGPVITFGIDIIVGIIRLFNLGETSSTAKLGEQIMAVVGLFVTGVVLGAAIFAILRARAEKSDTAYTISLAVGAAFGIAVILITTEVIGTATASPLASVIWVLALFTLWGGAHGQIYNDLSAIKRKPDTTVSVEAVDPERRKFLLRVGGATAGITVIGAGLSAFLGTRELGAETLTESIETASAVNPVQNVSANAEAAQQVVEQIVFPNADDPVIPAPGTRPEYTPLDDHYRIDINTIPPSIQEQDWTLQIGGMVENPATLTLADLRENYEPINEFVTLACISNPVAGDLTSTTYWTGVSLQKILAEVKPEAGATHLLVTSADGFDEYVSIDLINQDERVMLAYAWDNQPLKEKHGFPLRIYIPDHYGMKQPKWITNIEAVAEDGDGYWVRRGWDKVARMNATSVIDTVSRRAIYSEGDGQLFVPVGGIAHAGARGISRVEVSVDGGEWMEAQLRAPLSEVSWVIWRYDWPYQPGDHTFSVRCVEGDGTEQVETVQGTRPSGATGIHMRTANI